MDRDKLIEEQFNKEHAFNSYVIAKKEKLE